MMQIDKNDAKSERLELRDFEYDLPHHLIAQEPCAVRHQSKLLYLNRATGVVLHQNFYDLAALLKPTDLLIINDTRVVPAKLTATRPTGGSIKLLLLRPKTNKEGLWQAMATPIRRLKIGEILKIQGCTKQFNIKVKDIISANDGHKRLVVDLGSQKEVFELLNDAGQAPLPPYISRSDLETNNGQVKTTERQNDLERYQTIFAKAPGAVAAPTAALHFSDDVLKTLENKGIAIGKLTLHVGPGTFKPISDCIETHNVEPEEYSITEQTAELINTAKSEGRRIIAVGTTTCRALESASYHGIVQANQQAYTSLYIRPGFSFQVIDGLITNFHLSRSSLLLLVAAFAGHKPLMNAYKIAIENNYRFFSYGDAMLVL